MCTWNVLFSPLMADPCTWNVLEMYFFGLEICCVYLICTFKVKSFSHCTWNVLELYFKCTFLDLEHFPQISAVLEMYFFLDLFNLYLFCTFCDLRNVYFAFLIRKQKQVMWFPAAISNEQTTMAATQCLHVLLVLKMNKILDDVANIRC